jgi:hypothetical protein
MGSVGAGVVVKSTVSVISLGRVRFLVAIADLWEETGLDVEKPINYPLPALG